MRVLFPAPIVLAFLVASGSTAWGAQTGISPFSQAYDRYLRLCKDPTADRDQWLDLIRSFDAGRRNGSAHMRSKSLYLAGRASLVLYTREGRVEDLDNAIGYFNEVKTITRQKSKLPRILRELKTAHQLRSVHDSGFGHGSRQSIPPTVTTPTRAEMPTRSDASVMHVYGQMSDQESVDAFPELRGTSHYAKLSDVYQGNPFCPVRRIEQAPRSPSRVETASLPRSIVPPVVVDPPLRRETKRAFTVVIDPGHGGKDPGAVSSDGKLKEKDITLYISQRLKNMLEKKAPGIRVELTRNDDAFLTLTQRTAAANSLNADLFVSIHCNSYPDSSAQGIETYYLSKAGSARAMRVAARENDIPLSKMSDVEATLLDLMMTSKKSESEKLAETVHESLARITTGKVSPGRDRGVKRGPFYVLLGATMPAVLVECGYVSNATDMRRLGSKRYLDSIARGLASGAYTYLKGLGKEG